MSGLIIDDALPAVISAETHAKIDYVHAATNFLAAALFRKRNTAAACAACALGAAVLGNALLTDYPLGVFRVYSFRVHGILDYGVAAASAVIPALLGFPGSAEATYFYVQGAGETAIAGITDYEDDSGSKCCTGSFARSYGTRRSFGTGKSLGRGLFRRAA